MTIVDEFRQDESRVLDRLVDGELSQAERRTLLAALDDEPGAWRRCALAFLENQSWRWQLAQAAAEPMVAQSILQPNRVRPLTGRGTNRRALWGFCLASAASLLIAFGLGTRFPGNPPRIADDAADAKLAARDVAPQVPAVGNSDETVGDIPQVTEPDIEPTSVSPWETLTLAAAGEAGNGSAGREFSLRVRHDEFDAGDLEQLLVTEQSALPAMLVQQLEQEGWIVTRQRRLVPVDLSDGRRMVVPVEQVDLQPPEVAQL